MHRTLILMVSAALLTAACGNGEAGETPPTATTTAASTTSSAPTATSTTTTEPSTGTTPTATPPFLIYGWEGVTRVSGDVSTLLVAEPVVRAVEDGAGGILFLSVAEQPGWVWLPANAERPSRIVISGEGRPTGLFFPIDGRPSALVSRRYQAMTRCPQDDDVEELTIHDLETGSERFLECHGLGQDGGEYLTSAGGGLLSSVSWVAVGATGTDRFVSFYDLDGERVTVKHNPLSESCAPCLLSALLSPDGTLLAYTRWPTAYWSQPEPADGDITRAYRDWYAKQQHIPTEVVVMEMETGAEVLRTEVAADARLTEFDGRVVTVTTPNGGQRHDIATGDVVEVSEPAAFWTAVLASLDTDEMDYDAAQGVAAEFADDLGLITGVVWSDGYPTLNPGYWTVFTGHFATRDEALHNCELLDTTCYPGYVATGDTIGPETVQDMLTLQGHGLGLIRFGDLESDVLALMVKLIGSAPTDPGDTADWVEYAGWDDFGLFLGFSRPMWEDYDGVGRLVGWQLRGERDGLDLRTVHGVGVGTTSAELRAVYGDTLIIPDEPDVCAGLSVRLLHRDEGIVAFLDATGVVRSLHAGLGVGC
jgi:hypothetical protein